jgi:hypothetical protein
MTTNALDSLRDNRHIPLFFLLNLRLVIQSRPAVDRLAPFISASVTFDWFFLENSNVNHNKLGDLVSSGTCNPLHL